MEEELKLRQSLFIGTLFEILNIQKSQTYNFKKEICKQKEYKKNTERLRKSNNDLIILNNQLKKQNEILIVNEKKLKQNFKNQKEEDYKIIKSLKEEKDNIYNKFDFLGNNEDKVFIVIHSINVYVCEKIFPEILFVSKGDLSTKLKDITNKKIKYIYIQRNGISSKIISDIESFCINNNMKSKVFIAKNEKELIENISILKNKN